MLRIQFDQKRGSSSSDCDGIQRRDFLVAGSLAVGSLTLPQILQAGQSSGNDPGFLRDRSVVLLYLSGGASQFETFDPKIDAPAGIRSVTGSVATELSGVRFGGTFPRLANRAKQLSVVRSFQHPIGGHVQAHVHVLSGGSDPTGQGNTGFSMGAMVARLRGANHHETGMPTFGLLTEKEIDGQYRSELGRVRKGSHPGELGAAYAPFEPGNDGPSLANMTLSLSANRMGERKQLLTALDHFKRRRDKKVDHPRLGTIDAGYRQQAMELLFKGSTTALDLSGVDPRLMEQYDTSKIRIGHKVFRPSTLGKQMLMARRLCESGCGFVTVHSAGWDMHADSNNPGMVTGMNMLGRSLDKAVSAFLDDVRQRGLQDKILLVITGDFGRTPKVNKRGGRDHWARLCPLLFAGGGLKMGQIVGQSTKDGGEPATSAYTTRNLMGTIMHSLFDVGELRLVSGLPKNVAKHIELAKPIKELID